MKSEAALTDQVNRAKGQAEAVVLNSEAARTEQINRAQGQAESIRLVAQATADGISKVAEAIKKEGGSEAVALRIAEQYVDAFAHIAKTGNTVVIPANAADAGGMVAQALTIFDSLKKTA